MNRILALVLLAGCTVAPQLSLHLDQDLQSQCQAASSVDPNPAPPMTCEALTLDCADHVEFRLRSETMSGAPGDILRSVCLSTAEMGSPQNFCDLVKLPHPVSLLNDAPNGTNLILELRALILSDPQGGCDDENPSPTLVFSARSTPLAIDGQSHNVSVRLNYCSACPYRPMDAGVVSDGAGPASDLALAPDLSEPVEDAGAPSDMFSASDLGSGPSDLGSPPDMSSPPADMSPGTCPPGEQVSPYYPQGALCCPASSSDPCPAPGSRCPSGDTALLPVGGCCAVCLD